MEENIDEELKVGDKVGLKSKHIGTIVNINEFREPSMKYGIDIKGFNDIAFLGEEAILRKIEKQNNIDEDIENKIKKEDKIKNIIARAKEINDKSKESNSEPSLEGCLAIDILNLGIELETYKKIAEKLAEEISYTDNHICKYFDAINECKYEARKDNTNTCKQCIIYWARKEVTNDK